MTERRCNNKEPHEHNAYITNIEQAIDGNGESKYIVEGFATDEIAMEQVRQIAKDVGGIELHDSTDRNFHGFTSSRWNSPWEPEGPKKNWHTPPINPSLN